MIGRFGDTPSLSAEFYATLPTKQVAAGCILLDDSGRVLLVKPTYKEPWELPGGVVEHNESPLDACRRELAEELGIDRQPERLLGVDYRHGVEGLRGDALRFVFLGGTVEPAEYKAITLAEGELSEARFVALEDLDDFVQPVMARRIRAMVDAQGSVYLEEGAPPDVRGRDQSPADAARRTTSEGGVGDAIAEAPRSEAVPVLSVCDLEEAEAFYNRLGFSAASRHDGYLLLECAGAELHLSHRPEHDRAATDGMAYLRVADVEGLYDSLRQSLEAEGLLVLNPPGPLTPTVRSELDRRDSAGRPHNRLHELHDTPYGTREFAVIDPSGNLLRIGGRRPAASDAGLGGG